MVKFMSPFLIAALAENPEFFRKLQAAEQGAPMDSQQVQEDLQGERPMDVVDQDDVVDSENFVNRRLDFDFDSGGSEEVQGERPMSSDTASPADAETPSSDTASPADAETPSSDTASPAEVVEQQRWPWFLQVHTQEEVQTQEGQTQEGQTQEGQQHDHVKEVQTQEGQLRDCDLLVDEKCNCAGNVCSDSEICFTNQCYDPIVCELGDFGEDCQSEGKHWNTNSCTTNYLAPCKSKSLRTGFCIDDKCFDHLSLDTVERGIGSSLKLWNDWKLVLGKLEVQLLEQERGNEAETYLLLTRARHAAQVAKEQVIIETTIRPMTSTGTTTHPPLPAFINHIRYKTAYKTAYINYFNEKRLQYQGLQDDFRKEAENHQNEQYWLAQEEEQRNIQTSINEELSRRSDPRDENHHHHDAESRESARYAEAEAEAFKQRAAEASARLKLLSQEQQAFDKQLAQLFQKVEKLAEERVEYFVTRSKKYVKNNHPKFTTKTPLLTTTTDPELTTEPPHYTAPPEI